MRNCVAWSVDLLGEDAIAFAVFRDAAVFRGGFTLEAAEAVVTAPGREGVLEGLARLVDAHLLKALPRKRYAMLEVIWDYADQLLQSPEYAEHRIGLRDRHASFFAGMVEGWGHGMGISTTTEWLDRIQADYANVRAALAWADERRNGVLLGTLATGLAPFWDIRDPAGDGLAWLTRAVASSRESKPSTVPAWLYYWAGQNAQEHGGARDAIAYGAELVALAGDQGALVGVAIGLALQSQGRSSLCADDVDCHRGARDDATRALAVLDGLPEGADDPPDGFWGVRAWVLNRLGVTNHSIGDVDRAVAQYEQAIAIRRRLNDANTLPSTLANLAAVYGEQDDLDKAQTLYQESLRLAAEQQNQWVTFVTLIGLADIAAKRAETGLQRAAMLLGAADALRAEKGFDLYVHWERAHERATREVGPRSNYGCHWEQGARMTYAEVVKLASE